LQQLVAAMIALCIHHIVVFVVDCSAVSMTDEQEPPTQMICQDATTQQLHSADPGDWQRLVRVCFSQVLSELYAFHFAPRTIVNVLLCLKTLSLLHTCGWIAE